MVISDAPVRTARPALVLLYIRIGKTKLLDNCLIGRSLAETHRAA